MASAEFPNNLVTNTYILHDYLEIAYIVCTGAFQVVIHDTDSRNRALARLRNARQQFRQASILVVLDIEKLELITFYKKADIVKDQQAILAKFGQICKQNACKIERKNACRVIDLVKPDSARVWKLFSEAVIGSLTLQSPTGKQILNVGTNIFLVPEIDDIPKEGAVLANIETLYHLRKADLQIITGGYLLLAVRDSAWPPAYPLTNAVDSDGILPEKPPHGSIVYLLPTGQLARYMGGWIGFEDDVRPWEFYPEDFDRNELRSRVCWFGKVRKWLEDRDYRSAPILDDKIWCNVEIPVVENLDDQTKDREIVSWKTVVWPADLTYIFLDEKLSNPKDEIGNGTPDPLAAAQSWFSKDCGDVRAAANKDAFNMRDDGSFGDGNLFDDDPPFGSPQQFMNAPIQSLNTSQIVYPTPPEAMHPQHTPGLSMDGTAQTPMSAHPTQPSIYQSSPMATTADTDASHPHDSAISNFLQHNDDDLFEDEEDQKLVQPSFGDEPNWDFFDRDTTSLDMKPGLGFDDLTESPVLSKSPDIEINPRPNTTQTLRVAPDIPVQSPAKEETLHLASQNQSQEQYHSEEVMSSQSDLPGHLALNEALPSKIKDFATVGKSPSPGPVPPSAKRRRSSAYDINLQPPKGRDHKYGLSGKYHFEIRKPSTTSQEKDTTKTRGRRSTSSSLSSQSSRSDTIADNREGYDENSRLWTRYDPDLEIEVPESIWDEQYDDSAYMTEVDGLLEIVALAIGTEPFTSPPSPPRKGTDPDAGKVKSSERLFMIAQVLTEQLTQSSIFRYDDILQLPRARTPPPFDIYVENSEHGSNINNASLGDLATISPASSNPKLSTHVTPLEPNRVRLKQADGEISAELPIIKYWEVVNLQPLSGPKNVKALCLHPDGSNYVQGCDAFMRRMKETYTSCNLGTHERLKFKATADTGLLPWSPTSGPASLSSLCRRVGKQLASKNNQGCTIIYVIMPSDDLFHSIEICDAFLELFEALGHVNHSPENDIVLQLVPHSFVVDPDTLVVQAQKRYVDLALEVYNRTPGPNAHSPSDTASAVTLEKAVGRSLHFELNSKTSSPTLKSGHCCHLAYCISSDGEWLVACWSDTMGQMALTMPYRLVDGSDDSRRSRSDIFTHMCETSTHLMGRQKGQSWLAVAKVGIYEAEELQEWHYLAQKLHDDHKSISRIVILNVELQSRVSLHGTQLAFKQTNIPLQPGMNNLSTPATTPQAVIMSPEQAISVTPTTSATAIPQTPPDLSTDPGVEMDTYLSNPANEAWAITLAFGLNQTHNFLEIRPAMASGLLLKRILRPDNTGGLAMINVNLIAVPRKSNSSVTFAEREQMLQDVLVQYRGLHVLAVVRGCVADTDNCIPWHVATAFKGARVLERLI